MTRTARSRTARFTYTAVRSEGGLLPHELLEAIGGLSPELGITPTAYFLAEHEPLAEAQSRAWLRLVGLWRAFQAARQALPVGDAGVRLTRERWLLPLFDELGYGRLKVAAPVEVDGRVFAVSHAHGPVPIHLMGAGVDLDRPSAGVVGAAKVSPHGLVQDLLNRSDGHRWGMVTNGLRIRLLRDFHTLTRQAYVDFDLEAIFVGERFADFRLLWLVAHASRLGPAEATPGDPDSAPIEAWFQRARGEGTRALDRLRDGVQTAIERLGSGFLRHPQNHALQEALRSGNLSTHDYYRQLLRLVYRLIFVFVVEDRDVLLPALAADASAAARAAQARYRAHYATTHVRELAQRRRGGAHGDRWQALRLVLGKLYAGCPELGLPALGSYLFSHQAIPDLAAAELQSQDLLAALRALCTFEDGVVRRLVSWRSMGADELGSVYESLLELHPDDVHRESATFTLKTAAGNDRKTTGSYYTPHDLVESLLDSALEPVLTRAAAKSHAEAAILALRVCDPACGSGHFLVAAGRRIAHRLAQVRAADTEPSPQQVRHALRDVYAQCLFGVDLNPMAVELCKVSLWMEAIEPGRPLPFLDSHILQGNALLGATPALIARGLPESAFDALEGDDKEASKRLRKRHRDEFRGKATGVQQGLGFTPVTAAAAIDLTALAREAAAIDSLPDHDLADVEAKAARHRQRLARADQRDGTFIADAYCTAFLWPKDAEHEDSAPTHWLFAAKIRQYPNEAPTATRATVEDLARTYGLFHWHLAFPQVLSTPPPGTKPDNPQCGWDGGFDVVLGNPPWDHVELKEREFFAVLRPDIADAANAAARKKAIKALQTEDPTIHARFSAALRRVNGENLLLRDGGRFPLCGRGRINTYAVFAEHSRDILAPQGQLGIIVPAGIAMDDTTQDFFADLITGQQLVSMYHFENEDLLFLAVHHSYRFVLLTASGSGIATPTPSFAAFARQVAHLRDPERRYTLTADDFDRLNPNTRSFPAFRSRRDATINRAIYRRIPVLLRENREGGDPWSISFRQGTHNMASDSGMFRTREQLEAEDSLLHGNCFVRGSGRMFPLYEAKMIHHFDHRLGTYDGQTEAQANQGTLPALTREQHNNPSFLPLSRYWIPEVEVETRLLELDKPPERRHPWTRGWLLGWRDICRNSDIRTVIPCLIPRTGVGHTLPLVLAGNTNHLAFLAINLSLFVLDYAARQKVGGTHLTFGLLHQLPVLPPAAYAQTTPWSPGQSLAAWLLPRLLELTYTAWDLAAFARDHGYDGPPFRWDKDRRFWLRAELDAAYFHLYGLDRADIEHVMNSFWLVHQRDVKAHGSYRTREAIVDLYDRMARAIADRGSYATVLAPPPADSSLAHPRLGPEEAARLAALLEASRTPPPEPANPRKQATPGLLFADLPDSPPMAPDAPPAARRGAAAKAAAAASSRETKVNTPAAPTPEVLRLVSPISAPLRLLPPVTPPDDLHARTLLPDDPEVIRHLLADQDPAITPEILAALRALHRAARPLNRAELIDAAAIPAKRWTPTINALLDAGLVEKEGQKRGTTYRLA